MTDVLEQVEELTGAGWNFKLVLDQAYFDNDEYPLWQATFWNPSSTTMLFADGGNPWLAMDRALHKVEAFLVE